MCRRYAPQPCVRVRACACACVRARVCVCVCVCVCVVIREWRKKKSFHVRPADGYGAVPRGGGTPSGVGEAWQGRHGCGVPASSSPAQWSVMGRRRLVSHLSR
jgi:hypothetical protein